MREKIDFHEQNHIYLCRPKISKTRSFKYFLQTKFNIIYWVFKVFETKFLKIANSIGIVNIHFNENEFIQQLQSINLPMEKNFSPIAGNKSTAKDYTFSKIT